jgi:NAD(P)-dependent dehydrogenase (short-subunit alcohol dehydrogenase family)
MSGGNLFTPKVVGLMKSTALELGKHRFTVNALKPGFQQPKSRMVPL